MFENIAQVYRYRTLLKALVARHLAVRYRGSLLGFLWSFLNPLSLMLVYLIVFRFYIRYEGVNNYAIFMFCGLLPWIWMQSALIEGSISIVASGHLITKSMFPPQLLPVVTVTTGAVNFGLSLILLFIIMLFSAIGIKITWLLLPLVVIPLYIFLVGISLIIGTLNVYYRDVQHIVSNFLTFLFFLIPVVYPASAVPARFKFTMDLNPFAVFINSFHKILMDGTIPTWDNWIFMYTTSFLVLVLGNLIFTKYREQFAELL